MMRFKSGPYCESLLKKSICGIGSEKIELRLMEGEKVRRGH